MYCDNLMVLGKTPFTNYALKYEHELVLVCPVHTVSYEYEQIVLLV